MRARSFVFVCTGLLGLAFLPSRPAAAAWPTAPLVSAPLCAAANDQGYPKIVADGSGGAIVTWNDYRSGTDTDIYAQHVLASGVVNPAWPADGRALCIGAYVQGGTTIVSDGRGGAIVAWQDYRSGNSDIYAQRVFRSSGLGPTNVPSETSRSGITLVPGAVDPAQSGPQCHVHWWPCDHDPGCVWQNSVNYWQGLGHVPSGPTPAQRESMGQLKVRHR